MPGLTRAPAGVRPLSRYGMPAAVVATALVVGLAVAAAPLLLLALLAVGALALTAARPAVGVVLSIPVLLFGPTLMLQPGLETLQYADEGVIALLLAAAALRLVITDDRVVHSRVFAWAGVFLALGLVSSVVASVPAGVLVPAAALAVKGWLYAWVVAQVDWDARALRLLVRCWIAVLAVILVSSLLNLLAPAWWDAVAAGGGGVEYRWVLPSLVGPFSVAIQYGQVLAVMAGALWALAVGLRQNRRSLLVWAAVLVSVLALLSFRRLTLLAVLFALLVAFVVRRSGPLWAVVGASVPLLLALTLPSLVQVWDYTAQQYLRLDGGQARTVLTLRAFDVAADHFPFGAGFGRYGSYIAGDNYSPEYYALGFDRIYGLQPTPPFNLFLTDTFWPAVLGEAGYLGALAYVVAVVLVLRLAWASFRRSTGALRVVALMTLVAWGQALVLSPGGAVLTSGPNIVVPFILLGLLIRLSSARRAPVVDEVPAVAVA